MLSDTLIKFRTNNKLTQEYLAKRLGISRPTYIQIEKGERELNVVEAKKLAEIFGVSLEDFLQGKEGTQPEIVIQKEKSSKPTGNKQTTKSDTIRISVPQKNLKKFKEILLYVLNKVGSKPNIGESVLNKLFYFIDFDYYEKYEEQLIGATYIKNRFGPTPCELKKIIDEMKRDKEIEEIKSDYFQFQQKKYLPLRTPNLSILSAQELEHIDGILNRLSDKSAKDLTDYSHEDIPWKSHQDGEPISYESVFYRDEKYSVRSYDDDL